MSGCSTVITENWCVVTADGEQTIEQAALAKDSLMEALDAGSQVTLELSGVTGADLGFLQVLCSFCKSAQDRNTEVVVAGMSTALMEAASTCGLPDARCRGVRQCWAKGGQHVQEDNDRRRLCQHQADG